MLKYILLYLTCVAGFIACQSPAVKVYPESKKRAFINNKNEHYNRRDLSTLRLRGRVKMLREYVFNGPATDTLSGYAAKDYILFDSTGKYSERYAYNRDTLSARITFKYNAAGQWTFINYYDVAGTMTFRQFQVYDDKGYLLKEGQINNDGDTTKPREYTYDQYGGLIKEQIPEGTIVFKNTYDDEGILTVRVSSFNKKPGGRTIWEYDSIGYMVNETLYDMNGKPQAWTRNKLNERNLVTLQTIKDLDQPETVTRMEYDSLDNVINTVYIEPTTGVPGSNTRTSYVYDATGNWTRYISHAAGDTLTTIIRVITYY